MQRIFLANAQHGLEYSPAAFLQIQNSDLAEAESIAGIIVEHQALAALEL